MTTSIDESERAAGRDPRLKHDPRPCERLPDLLDRGPHEVKGIGGDWELYGVSGGRPPR